MNRDEGATYASHIYGGYEGERAYRDEELPMRGQKLGGNDEVLYDSLVRRIKQELQAESRKASERSAGQRLMLALVSVCALIVLFGLIVVALAFGHLSGDATSLLGGTMFFLLGAIIMINAFFNFGSTAGKTQKKKGGGEKG